MTSSSTRTKTRYPNIYRRYGKYEIAYTDSKSQRVFKAMPVGFTLQDAHMELNRILEKMYGGQIVVRSKMTLEECVDKYLDSAKNLRPKTRKVYESSAKAQVKPRLGHVKVSDLTWHQVAGMMNEMTEEGLSSWTVRGALTVVSGACVYAMERGIIGTNPCSQIPRRHKPVNTSKPMRILQPEEISALLRKSEEPYRLLFKTLIFTGLRIGEAMRLEWQDVDFDLQRLTVRESKTEAGLRTVELPEFLLQDLASLPGKDGPVFLGEKGLKIQLTCVYRAYRKALTASQLPKMRIHDLRHTFASLLIAQGEDIVYVASQMGHSNPGVTLKTYAKLFDGDARKVKAREKMHLRFEGVAG